MRSPVLPKSILCVLSSLWTMTASVPKHSQKRGLHSWAMVAVPQRRMAERFLSPGHVQQSPEQGWLPAHCSFSPRREQCPHSSLLWGFTLSSQGNKGTKVVTSVFSSWSPLSEATAEESIYSVNLLHFWLSMQRS